jgi:GNAT superfamily N-acetyltransferase
MADLVAGVCAAYAWQRALGHEVVEGPLWRIVRDPAHPHIWDANHVSGIRADSAAEIDAMLGAADAALAHCRHRLFVVDPLTPARRRRAPGARRLPRADAHHSDGARGTAARRSAGRRPAAGDGRGRLAIPRRAARRRPRRGARTGGPLPDHVTEDAGAYRAKAPACQFYLARIDGDDCAYGAAVRCSAGLQTRPIGMVEDLFTLPTRRRRGIASAIIARAVTDLRRRGAGPILIGAHAGEPPKRLYAALGFVPVCVTREYFADRTT